ncbi:hypothetical protein NW762_009871 [Fusarium torreyae]|uniref:Uncharacterized protein n=1 Tax=Fusarium torreyae TaxID=1237075 RepID=A0A9W8VC85_9HYPO|nr:hypothetical protein NW762_009871 [Fusarium torreyae]
MTLPFVEVSHLASSSSFYSATLQTLGLRFLNESRDHDSSIGTITYGIPAGATRPGSKHRKAVTDGRGDEDRGQPVLQIREVTRPFEPVKLSTLVFAVASPDQVVDFHDVALTANPWLSIQTDGDPIYPGGPSPRAPLGIEGGEIPRRATVRDLDGNTIQVVYRQPTSSRDHFGRVIEWTYDGATRTIHTSHTTHTTQTKSRSFSQPQIQPQGVTSARSSSSSINGQSPFQPRQSPAKHGPNTVTAAEMTQRAATRADNEEPVSVSPRQSSNGNGLSTTTVVGAILGVAAAGAALTYGLASYSAKERERKPRQDYEAPALPRRSTFPEKAPTVHKLHESRRVVQGDYPPKTAPRPGDYPPKALPYRGHGGFAPQEMYPDGYPFQQHMQDNYAPRKMSHHDSYPPRNLGYVEDESSEDSPDEKPRQIQYLTQTPFEEENPWASSVNRARSRSRPRSSGKSTTKSVAAKSVAAKSVAAKSVAQSTRSVAKSTAKSVAPSRARSRSRAPMDEEYDDTRSRHTSRHPQPEDAYEFVETRSRRSSRPPPTDGFDTRSRRSSRPPQDDGFDTRSRRSSRHPPEDGFERSRRSSRPPVTEKSRGVRARSEAGVHRSKSVVLVDDHRSEAPFRPKFDDHRSHAGSRHTTVPKSSQSVVRPQRSPYDDERTYFSARSRPSSRAPRRSHRPDAEMMEAPEVPQVPDAPEIPLDPDYEVPDMPDMRSRTGSRYNVSRRASGPEYQHMGYPSKAQSYVSAKNIALPMSGVGSSHAQWDDDMVSVAPSDSISCIGTKPSRRSRKIR